MEKQKKQGNKKVVSIALSYQKDLEKGKLDLISFMKLIEFSDFFLSDEKHSSSKLNLLQYLYDMLSKSSKLDSKTILMKPELFLYLMEFNTRKEKKEQLDLSKDFLQRHIAKRLVQVSNSKEFSYYTLAIFIKILTSWKNTDKTNNTASLFDSTLKEIQDENVIEIIKQIQLFLSEVDSLFQFDEDKLLCSYQLLKGKIFSCSK